jgi:hypothetical protein
MPRTKTSKPVLDFVVTAHQIYIIIIVHLIKSFFWKKSSCRIGASLFFFNPFKKSDFIEYEKKVVTATQMMYFQCTIMAPVAQWIEQWIPNPCAASSILAGGTNKYKWLANKC